MKNIVFGVVLMMIGFFALVIILTVNSQSTRKNEMDDSLSQATQTAVESVMQQKSYTIYDNQTFINDVIENLALQIDAASDLEVKITSMDYRKGLLGMKVTQTYQNPNGKEGKAVYETTVLFQNTSEEHSDCKITFLNADDSFLQEYQIVKGDPVILPKEPQLDGKVFVNWIDIDTGATLESQSTVEDNATYRAVYQ